MTDLIYLGFDREGLEEAREDQRRYATEGATKLDGPFISVEDLILRAIKCNHPWPTR